MYCNCLHDSRDSPGRRVGISTYRNRPKCAKNDNFLASNWEHFGGELGRKEDILDWEWGRISDPGDREKRPCKYLSLVPSFQIFNHKGSHFRFT